MPQSLAPTFNETQQCTNLSAPPPQVILSPTVPCPTSGELHCLATVPFFPCTNDPTKMCGAAGRFLPECNAIELPDQWTDAAAHEMIHYLLRASGHDDWAVHTDPAFACQ
jgi:hypothetical protein